MPQFKDVLTAVRAPRHFRNTGVFDAIKEVEEDLPRGWGCNYGRIEDSQKSFCVVVGSVSVRPSDGAYALYAYKKDKMSEWRDRQYQARKKAEEKEAARAATARNRAAR